MPQISLIQNFRNILDDSIKQVVVQSAVPVSNEGTAFDGDDFAPLDDSSSDESSERYSADSDLDAMSTSSDESVISEDDDVDLLDCEMGLHLDSSQELLVDLVHLREILPRYWCPRDHLQRGEGISKLKNYLRQMDDLDFCCHMRMSRNSFELVLQRIINHPAFSTSATQASQTEPWMQLAISLEKLGGFGNPAKDALWLRPEFQIGVGTVNLFTDRVVAALCCLKDEVTTFFLWTLMDIHFRSSFGQI